MRVPLLRAFSVDDDEAARAFGAAAKATIDGTQPGGVFLAKDGIIVAYVLGGRDDRADTLARIAAQATGANLFQKPTDG